MQPAIQKFLLGYATVSSTVLLCVVLLGAKKPHLSEFDEIRVHRINVVEPDGTLRMVISNKKRLPTVLIKGKANSKAGEPRPQAGMIFYNDEGSENGGLIFGGRKDEQGKIVDSGGSLSFDQYNAGQIVQLAGVHDSKDQFAGVSIKKSGQKIWIGHREHEGASVSLSDTEGKRRIVMQVSPDGTPSLAFFDSGGHKIQELAPPRSGNN